MNYMKEVAHILGVELGEEFKIKELEDSKYELTMEGVLSHDEDDDKDWVERYVLNNILKGVFTIIKKPILDEAEREYLSNVIKPFRDNVRFISKIKWLDKGEFIRVTFKWNQGDMDFPFFEEGTMYKGMIEGKDYSVEDFGV